VRKALIDSLSQNRVRLVGGIRQFREITLKGMAVIDADGREALIEASLVVLATGLRPLDELDASVRGKVAELYEAGDCVSPRRILEAIHEGADAAIKI
jgi:thioredoxin reductase